MKPELTKSKGGSVFRKIAMGTWRTAGDPSVYGLIEIDVSKTLKHIETLQKQSKVKITISHVVGKAIALTMKERPEINGLIRFRRIYLRKHVDLFYQINVPGDPSDPVGKATLSGEVIRKAENLSVIQIAEELERKIENLRTGKDGQLSKTMSMMRFAPWQLMHLILSLTSFLTLDLKLNLKWLGIPEDPFGSVMITNVGALGVGAAWAPIVPYSKVPLLLTIGMIEDRPWVVDGKIEIRPILRIGVTFDHRFMDGIHAAVMNRRFTEFFAHPEKYF